MDTAIQTITTYAADSAAGEQEPSLEPIVGTVGALAAVAAIAAVVVYKKRQRLLSPGLYLGAAATPVQH
jgi:hypothetical protein